jgi:hypothetical protein
MSIESLHIYGQEQYHEEACIVGDRNSLMRLRTMIDRALTPGLGMESKLFFASDGEGFNLHVVNFEGKEGWDRIAVPYTGAAACEKREDAVWPHTIILDRQNRTV